MAYADTNHTMDKCFSCGGNPGLEYNLVNGKELIRGHCCDCCETGPAWEENYGLAVIAWNKQQREQKARSVHIGDTQVIVPKKRG